MPKIVYTDEFKRDAVALVASGIPQNVHGRGKVPTGGHVRSPRVAK